MKILVVEPGKEPYVTEITGDSKSMEDVVGGETFIAYGGPQVVLICNNEINPLNLEGDPSKLNENRIYWDKMIYGTFFIVGVKFIKNENYNESEVSSEPEFSNFEYMSLSDFDIDTYSKFFQL